MTMETEDWLLAIFAIVVIKMLVVNPEIEYWKLKKRKDEEAKKIPNPQKIKKEPKEIKEDFFGTNLMREDPNRFIKNVEENQKRMEAGEDVGMKAAEAFFMIRNSAHSNLIVGENGTINMKIHAENCDEENEERDKLVQSIWDFQPADRKAEDALPERVIPGYVDHVEELKDGAQRWVYEKWHADECGIKTLCLDKFGRPMPDPDAPKDDDRKKGKGQKDFGENYAQEDGLGLIALKEVTVLKEMVMEDRAAILLAAAVSPSANVDATPEHKIVTEKKEAKKVPEVLKQTPYLSEIDQLKIDFPPPDFESMFSEKKLSKDEEKIIIEDENDFVEIKNQFEYHDDNFFLERLCSDPNFIEAVFESVFSENGSFFVFADFQNRQFLIEKNYLVRAMRDLFAQEERIIFERDFLEKDAAIIFDGLKINQVLLKINSKTEMFLTYGRYENKLLFNILLQQGDDFISGWFAKIKFDACKNADNFQEKYAKHDEITIIASLPAEIKARSKQLKGIRRFY